VEVEINEVATTALLDTGSVVSLISETFHREHLGTDIKPLEDILNIETASGESLPYKGYIEAELNIQEGVGKAGTHTCLFLIVPDTQYSVRTPVLIGTNILSGLLSECKENFGVRFIQKASLHIPWYLTFRAMVLTDRELKRKKDRIAIVRCAATAKIILRPNETIDIPAYADKKMRYLNTAAVLLETPEATMSNDIDVAPGLVNFEYEKKTIFHVTLSNLTTNTVAISPKEFICELQPVTIEEEVIERMEGETMEQRQEKIVKGFEEETLEQRQEKIVEGLVIDEDNIMDKGQADGFKELLMKHKDIFATSDIDIGQCNKVKHRIDLLDDVPFKLRHRRIPPNMIDEVRGHLEQLLSSGIIRPSKSPYASPVVLVRKKTGKLRLCIDYRMLNSKTVKDSYALPRIEEIFDSLNGAKYFSTIDMKSGYHQIEVEERHKERTSFSAGALGFWEFNKMPFGLSCAPATMQRVVEECLGELNMKVCVSYIDDLIIYSKTYEEHLVNIDKVFARLKACGLKLAPEKCEFFKTKVSFLGHVVSGDGIETDPKKIEKVTKWPTPANADELRSFLAFAGYYRRFIKDFSKISRPLSELLPPTVGKNKKSKKDWKWGPEEQKVFDDLKVTLSTPPVLAYPDYQKPFELHTDASQQGLGAVLYQEQEGQKRVIAYASRALSKSEKNYSAYKLEFLALKWGVTEKFSDYLAMNQFTVLTDNNPLTYILTTAKLDATGQRWASALGEYNFNIFYRAGLKNADADAMSRYPHEKVIQESTVMIKLEDTSVKAICCCFIRTCPLIETLPAMTINIVEATEDPGQGLAQIELREIRRMQRQDNLIERWRLAVIDQQMPRDNWSKEDLTMKRQFKHFKMRRGVLYRLVQADEGTIEQLVLPEVYRKDVLRGLHDDIGHPGKERMMRLMRDRYYWAGMTHDVDQWVEKCPRCLRRKTTVHSKAPLVNVTTTYPLELVCFDFLTLEPSKGGFGNVLVITDHYTKYAIAIPTRNQTAKTTAEVFYNEYILHYGIPTRLHSDQGANFESEIIKELCKLTNMKKTHTSIYHPQGNAGPERMNRTLLNMLGTLENSQKADWKRYIASLVYAYNCTPHETTRVSPYELMFGRKAKLPIDATFERAFPETGNKVAKEYMEDLKDRILKTQKIVKEHNEKAQNKQKKSYDKKAKAVRVEVGDKVIVKILAHEGKHKIADKFEEEIYAVIEQPRDEIPVFVVKGLDSGRIRTLHRNHLHPVDVDDDAVRGDEDAENQPDDTVIDASEGGRSVADEDMNISDVTDESDDDEVLLAPVPETRARGDPEALEQSVVDRQRRVEVDETSDDREESGVVEETHTVDTPVQESTDQSIGEVEQDSEGSENDLTAVDRSASSRNVDDDVGEDEVVDRDRDIDVDNNHDFNSSISDDDVVNENTVDDTGQNARTENVQISQPVPQPRRSNRPRRQPERYSDYQMYSVQQRPVEKDSKLRAINVLVASGVLSDMDTDMAKKLIESIMK